MSHRQYATFRVGDDVIHVDVQPTPPAGYEVNVSKAIVGGPPRPLHEATIHANVHEAQEYFVTMCRKVLDAIEIAPEYIPRTVPSLAGVDIIDLTETKE